MENSVSSVELKQRLAEVVNTVAYAKKRITLTRRGKKVVAIVPVEDLDLLEALEDRIDLEEALKALQESAEEGSTALSDFEKELGFK